MAEKLDCSVGGALRLKGDGGVKKKYSLFLIVNSLSIVYFGTGKRRRRLKR